ncbi:DUF1905 domain-containing protein [Brevibacillus sp. 179-C9.3 HS]|uniref:DUF1905 domain-containing protein n=1 Tax=unclassified Brevibacillus TaxID=2684853 RepID=UPI0039A0B7A3
MDLDKAFTATITKDAGKSGWTCVVWPESVRFFGTGKPVKVIGTVDGHDFQATFLPLGDGTHMLPLRAAVMTKIKKQVGEQVEVHLRERL